MPFAHYLFICFVTLYFILHFSIRSVGKPVEAWRTWQEAKEIFSSWRWNNPGVCIGLSDEGRELLLCELKTYDECLEVYPFSDGDEYREWLLSLLDDFPPKPRKIILTRLKPRDKKSRGFLMLNRQHSVAIV